MHIIGLHIHNNTCEVCSKFCVVTYAFLVSFFLPGEGGGGSEFRGIGKGAHALRVESLVSLKCGSCYSEGWYVTFYDRTFPSSQIHDRIFFWGGGGGGEGVG